MSRLCSLPSATFFIHFHKTYYLVPLDGKLPLKKSELVWYGREVSLHREHLNVEKTKVPIESWATVRKSSIEWVSSSGMMQRHKLGVNSWSEC